MEPLQLFTRRQVLSVAELVGQLKTLAETHFDFVWVEGEVSGLRRPGSGHVYFALKDEQAILRAVLFRPQASLLRFALSDGQRVLCQGRLSVYPPRGDVQLIIDSVEPRGAGALALAFAQLRRRLEAEGLFDSERKRPLPDLPQRVAVVTSPTGAAIRDFLHVLARRFDRMQVAVYPVPVQGDEAAERMIQALADLNAWGWPEVIVLTRGGGSPEDLWAFNHEGLARAIAASPIPVVSAVGHEVDVTIADLVADLRAATPSAAAEILVRPRADLAARLTDLRGRLLASARRALAGRRLALMALTRALGDPRRRLIDRRLRVEDLASRAVHAMKARIHGGERRVWRLKDSLLARGPQARLREQRADARDLSRRLVAAMARGLDERRALLGKTQAGLRALGPMAVLSRGYALVSDERGALLRAADQARPGQVIGVRLLNGRLRARVEEVLP